MDSGHFSLKISANLEGNGQRLVKWAKFVQPKAIKDVLSPTGLGPIKQAQHAHVAKTQPLQSSALNHMKTQSLS